MNITLFYDPLFLEHKPGALHPENPRRLSAIVQRLRQGKLSESIDWRQPKPVETDILLEVHDSDYVHRLSELKGLSVSLDSDTHTSPASIDAAMLAAGGACMAAEYALKHPGCAVMNACRPPGHHATRKRAMGFCLLNNVAVAAAYALKQPGVNRVLIIDWDVHHGNGTQDIFYASDTVFYLSLHQHPLYPGSGTENETGRDAGEGFTLNIPLPPGSTDTDWIKALEKGLETTAARFSPDMVLISAGFDAHREDPLAGTELTENGFYKMTEMTRQFAAAHCRGCLASVLEGGYAVSALSASVEKHLEALWV